MWRGTAVGGRRDAAREGEHGESRDRGCDWDPAAMHLLVPPFGL
jgi:hypothetical protein